MRPGHSRLHWPVRPLGGAGPAANVILAEKPMPEQGKEECEEKVFSDREEILFLEDHISCPN